MSHPRFAPITAGLLARKGNAAPSSMTGFVLPARLELPSTPVEKIEPPQHIEAPPHLGTDAHHKKLFVSLSHPEHERLSIASVKTGLTRHQLIRDALDLYFEQLSRDLGHDCRCVAGTVCGNSC
jgi:hypothetical protein